MRYYTLLSLVLIQEDYLKIISVLKGTVLLSTYYIATEKGISNGITNEERSGREGKYNVLLCTYEAKKMIVSNLDVIADYKSIDKKQNEELIETNDTNTDTTCKKCMLYRNETCFGEKEICEDFKRAVDISEDEIAMWPKEMTGPYGTLHRRR